MLLTDAHAQLMLTESTLAVGIIRTSVYSFEYHLSLYPYECELTECKQ